MLPLKHITKYCRLLLPAIVGVILATGCGEDVDIVKIDISKKIALSSPSEPARSETLVVAVAAMVSPEETVTYYRQLLNYLADGLDVGIDLTQRKTYAEINELLGKGEIDLAFICSGPYASARERYGFEALAVPLVRNSAVYRSYLIVNQSSTIDELEGLRGKVFAFTDPDSNTGCIVPRYLLMQKGESADSFFGKTVFTYSHDNSIFAVARALVDGAFVHEQIWEYFHQRDPRYTARTRVIFKSEPFGNPPLVASKHLAGPMKVKIRNLLLAMHADPRGLAILNELLIERFVPIDDRLYEPVRHMMAELKRGEDGSASVAEP